MRRNPKVMNRVMEAEKIYSGTPPGGTGPWEKLGSSNKTARIWTFVKLLGKEK